MKRQIVLDTETTGLEPALGHRVIEIGCVELIDRRLSGNDFHQYLQPDRESDAAALEVHGITSEFLADKPRFGDVVEDFIQYISGAELIIHNAPFDVGFIDAELQRLQGWENLDNYCTVTDSLVLARTKHPGQRVSLDALCGRYDIDNSQRTKHGALLDAEILAEVYLAMTGGQATLSLDAEETDDENGQSHAIRRLPADRPLLPVVRASKDEQAAHRERLQALEESCEKGCIWLRLEGAAKG